MCGGVDTLRRRGRGNPRPGAKSRDLFSDARSVEAKELPRLRDYSPQGDSSGGFHVGVQELCSRAFTALRCAATNLSRKRTIQCARGMLRACMTHGS